MSHIVRERTAVDRQRVRKGIRYKMIYIAGLLAALIVFAVQTGTRYVMNDWTREKLERVMTMNLHRKVLLRQATWSLGINGLVIAVENMVVLDRIGDAPFITSDYSEIGVPLLPLLAGSLEARSITFKNPKLYAVKIGKFRWNFSDLPDVDALRNVSYVDLKGGELHIIDRSNNPPAAWSPRVLRNGSFHLERPFQNRTWPFQLSFRIPHRGYVTDILLTGIGNGNIHDWAKNNHQFDLKATDINLQDFSDAIPQVPPISGRLNLEVHGEGVPEKSFAVKAIVRSPLMTIETPGFGALTIRDGVTSGQLTANEQMLAWNDVIVNLGRGFQLKSNGRVLEYKSDKPKYEVTVLAQTDNLSKMARVLPAQLLPSQLLDPATAARVRADRQRRISIEQALAPAKLTGSVIVRARVKGQGKDRPDVWADIDAKNITMNALAQLRPLQNNPVVGVLGANPRTRLDMHLSVDTTGRSTIDRAAIVLGRSRINMNGWIDTNRNQMLLTYTSRNLNLAELAPGLRESDAMRKLNASLGLPANTRLQLSGLMDIDGTMRGAMERPTMSVVSQLKNVGVSIGNGQLRANRINGHLTYDGTTVIANKVTGFVNNGGFQLDGSVSSAPNGPVNVVYRGKTIELSAVKQAAAMMNINSPLLRSPHLRGNIDDVVLIVTGTNSRPSVTIHGNPRDITFQPPGAPGFVRLTTGSFSVRDNQVVFQDVRGTIGSGSFALSGSAGSASSNITMTGTNIDISHFRQALIDLGVNAPVITGPQILYGTMRHAVLVIRTSGNDTQFSLTGSPRDVYYKTKEVPRAFVLTGGNINLTNTLAVLHNLRGTLGSGTFVLNGRMPLNNRGPADIAFSGRNLDLSNIKAALVALNVKSPLLEQQLLYGKVHSLVFNMKGDPNKPVITLEARPADVRFEPHGSQRTMRVVGGLVTYKDDAFTGRDLAIVNNRSRILVSLRVEDLSKTSRLTDFHLRTTDLDVGDLASYLAANSTPSTIRQPFITILELYGIENPRGTLAGQFDYTHATSHAPMQLFARMTMKNMGVTVRGINFSDVNGLIRSENDTLIAQGVTGKLEGQALALNMVVRDLKTDFPTWSGEISTTLNVRDQLGKLPGDLSQLVHITEDIPVKIGFVGNPSRTAAVFTGSLTPGAEFSFQAPIGTITKPVGEPVTVVGMMVFRPTKPTVLTFYDSHVDIGATRVAWKGTYQWPAVATNEQPHIDFTFSLPNPVSARTLLTLLPAPALEEFVGNMTGGLGGEVRLVGPLNSPASSGYVNLHNVAIPALNISNINGVLRAVDLFPTRRPEATVDITGPVSVATIDLRSLTAGSKITLHEIRGNVLSERTPEGERWSLENVTASVYGGCATVNGSILLMPDRPFEVTASLANVDIDAIATQAFCAPGEVTGRLNAYATLSGRAGNKDQLVHSLVGNARFAIIDGSAKVLGELESGVQKLNLLREGLFGLNINNVVKALANVSTGEFDSFSGNLRVANSVVDVDQLSFIGDELRLRGQGQVQLATQDARLHIAGNIPRTAKGILKGPIGAFLQHLSIRNILNIATLGLMPELPDIPILGKLGADRKPRAFQFVAEGNLRDPDSFTQSVLNTFRWLPNERYATPHPVFGVGAQPEAVPQ